MRKRPDQRLEARAGDKKRTYEPPGNTSYFDEGAQEESAEMPADDWALPFSDLMMTMFILFAMIYAYSLAERDITEAFQVEQVVGTSLGGGFPGEASFGNFSSKGTGTFLEGTRPGGAPSAQNSSKEILKEQSGGTGSGELGSGKGSPNSEPPSDVSETGLTPEQLLELSEKAMKESNIDDVDVVLQDDKTVKISLRGPLLFDSGKADLRGETVSFLKKVAHVLSKIDNEVHVIGHTDNFPIHNPIFPTNWELSVARASAIGRYLIQEGRLQPGRFTVMGHSLYRPVAPNTSPENKQKNRRVEIVITRKIYKETQGA